MTDDEQAMAYADGELDALDAKRFEKRVAEAPDLAHAVEAHRTLREQLRSGFATVAEAPLPDRLTALLHTNVEALRPNARIASIWRVAASMAACLVAGVAIGHFWPAPSAGVSGGQLVATGPLATALDHHLAGGHEPTRMLVSFRDTRGKYCRVFDAPEIAGIACRENATWSLRRTQSNAREATPEYRQASSGDPTLLAAAQAMMAGDPLDAAEERAASEKKWRN